MSESKWVTVNGVRYPNEGCDTGFPIEQPPTTYSKVPDKESECPPDEDPEIHKKNKETAMRLMKEKIQEDFKPENLSETLEGLKVNMDENNSKAVDVWLKEGTDSMLKQIMTNEDGSPMSYAQSRALYG